MVERLRHKPIEDSEHAALLCLVYLAWADSYLAEAERERLREAIRQRDLPLDDRELLFDALREPLTPEGLAARIPDPAGRRAALDEAYRTAYADGAMVEAERVALADLARCFGLSEEDAEALRAQAEAEAGERPGPALDKALEERLGRLAEAATKAG